MNTHNHSRDDEFRMIIEQGDVIKSNCRGGCVVLLDVALGEGFFEETDEQIPAV